MTERFIAGWNMPGYLPESKPAIFDEKSDAITYIREEIEHAWESFEATGDADADEKATQYLEAHTALHNGPNVPLFVEVDGYVYWIEFYNEDDEGEGSCMACGCLAVLDCDGENVRHLDENHDKICTVCTA